MTYVKTKRKSRGFMQTRITKGKNSRRRTCRSRRKSPAKACTYCMVFEVSAPRLTCGRVVWSSASSVIRFSLRQLLAKVSPGQADKNRLKAGFGDGQVAQ